MLQFVTSHLGLPKLLKMKTNIGSDISGSIHVMNMNSLAPSHRHLSLSTSNPATVILLKVVPSALNPHRLVRAKYHHLVTLQPAPTTQAEHHNMPRLQPPHTLPCYPLHTAGPPATLFESKPCHWQSRLQRDPLMHTTKPLTRINIPACSAFQQLLARRRATQNHTQSDCGLLQLPPILPQASAVYFKTSFWGFCKFYYCTPIKLLKMSAEQKLHINIICYMSSLSHCIDNWIPVQNMR